MKKITVLTIIIIILLTGLNPVLSQENSPGGCIYAFGMPRNAWQINREANGFPINIWELEEVLKIESLGNLVANYDLDRWDNEAGEPIFLEWSYLQYTIFVDFDEEMTGYDPARDADAWITIGFYDENPEEAYIAIALKELDWHCCAAYIINRTDILPYRR